RWVDLGAPAPTHGELARYLKWVLERATHGVQLKSATVTQCEFADEGWRVGCEGADRSHEIVVAEQGLVLTGPGTARTVPFAEDVAHRIIAPRMHTTELEAIYLPPAARVCIIGNGESAVSMALWLIARRGDGLQLTFVAPTLPYSRAESFFENSIYSDPHVIVWDRLGEDQRTEFVRRTDRGVMSPAALARLARHRALSFVVGRVRLIQLGRS